MKRGTRPTSRYVKTDDGIYIGYQVYGDGPYDLVVNDGWMTNGGGAERSVREQRCQLANRALPSSVRGDDLGHPSTPNPDLLLR
jgi:hypothetical protein